MLLRFFVLTSCLTALALTSQVCAQQKDDVVYPKNGSIIRGTIIEQIPGESLKIQTQGGNVFVLTMDDIDKIVRGGRIGAKQKNPWLAGGMSVIPGAGQFYNGQYKKGVYFFCFSILGIAYIRSGFEDDYENRLGHTVDPDDDNLNAGIGLIIWLGSHVTSVLDAFDSAKRINQQSQKPYYGHLLEFDGNRATLGIDPVVRRNGSGARLTLHF